MSLRKNCLKLYTNKLYFAFHEHRAFPLVGTKCKVIIVLCLYKTKNRVRLRRLKEATTISFSLMKKK